MQCGRGCCLWAEFAPFPYPLPPASGGAGPVRCRLAPLDLLRPFVLRTAGGGVFVFGLVNFPQFKSVSHKSSLRLPSGHSGLESYPKQCRRSSPFRPHLLVADAGVWGTFLLGVAFRHVICGVYLFICLFIFLPVRLPSKIQKLPPDPTVRGFPGVCLF